jgi:hypothetical protein
VFGDEAKQSLRLIKYSLEVIFLQWHISPMKWEIEYTDEFEGWWDRLNEAEQDSVEASVMLLGDLGPHLGFPHSCDIKGSRHGHLRELRIQHGGKPFRVLYAFDPRRCAISLIGGDKTGQGRWYDEHVPKAERLYDEHLETLKNEGYDNG